MEMPWVIEKSARAECTSCSLSMLAWTEKYYDGIINELLDLMMVRLASHVAMLYLGSCVVVL